MNEFNIDQLTFIRDIVTKENEEKLLKIVPVYTNFDRVYILEGNIFEVIPFDEIYENRCKIVDFKNYIPDVYKQITIRDFITFTDDPKGMRVYLNDKDTSLVRSMNICVSNVKPQNNLKVIGVLLFSIILSPLFIIIGIYINIKIWIIKRF